VSPDDAPELKQSSSGLPMRLGLRAGQGGIKANLVALKAHPDLGLLMGKCSMSRWVVGS